MRASKIFIWSVFGIWLWIMLSIVVSPTTQLGWGDKAVTIIGMSIVIAAVAIALYVVTFFIPEALAVSRNLKIISLGNKELEKTIDKMKVRSKELDEKLKRLHDRNARRTTIRAGVKMITM